MIKKLSIILIAFFIFLFLANTSFASTLYLSPGSANIPQGSIVSVQVRLNAGGESINGISAYLSYPSDKLEVSSLSFGSSFPIAAEGSYGGGGIRISRGSISGVTGDVNVATIRFKGKSQGVGTVSFIGGSGAPRASDSSDSLNLGGSRGGTFTVGSPSSTSTSTSTSSPKTSPTSIPLPKDTTQPIISNVVVSSISTNSATITWQTDEKSDSVVEYGLEKDRYFLETSSKDLVQNHSIILEGNLLTPGTLLHFRVKSLDGANNEGVSSDLTIKLKGYNVRITILDKNNKPIKDTDVLLYKDSLRATTNLTGEVLFTDVAPTKHLVVVKLNNSFDKTQEINVMDNLPFQNFTLKIDQSSPNSPALYIGLLITILGLLGAVFVYWSMRKDTANATNRST